MCNHARMALDLEIAGPVRELAEGERGVNVAPMLKRLRDSHHAVARLLAHGLTPFQVSLQTGYSPSRISTLQADPNFSFTLPKASLNVLRGRVEK